MTDNFSFTPGSGETGAAKNVGGVLYPQVIATEIDGTDTGLSAKLGSLTETAPASDTASSGINGRLQRIAQRLTTLMGSTIAVSGTFWQAVQPVSGTFWQATQPVSQADGAQVTFGTKADAKSTATDTTAVTAMSVWKQISASVQAIATAIAGTLTATVSGSVTANAGTNLNTSALALETGGNLATIAGAVSSSKMAVKAASGDFADGALATIGAKADAKNSATDTTAVSGISIWKQISASVQAIATSVAGTLTVATHGVTIADGSDTTQGAKADAKNSATDTTAISIMSVLKQISFSIQAAASSLSGTLTVGSHNVTNAGTFAVQATEADGAHTTFGSKADAKNSATDTTAITAMSVWKQISSSVQAIATSVAGTLTVATHAVTQSGTWNVTVNAAIAAGTNIIGKFGIDQTTPGTTNGITPVPATAGGPSEARIMSAASTNATSTKASAGQVYGWYLYNNTASAKFFKFYNKASSPTVGTDTPARTISIPANGGTNVEFSMGIPMGTGIAYAITGAIADSDTTAVAANDVTGFFLYK